MTYQTSRVLAAGGDRPDGILRRHVRRGPGQLLLPSGLCRCFTARALAGPASPWRRRGIVVEFIQIIEFIEFIELIALVIFRVHRQDAELGFAARARTQRVGGQDGGPNVLAGRVFLVAGQEQQTANCSRLNSQSSTTSYCTLS